MAETRFIQETSVPGAVTGRLVTLDPRIIIDDYDPKYPNVLWYCDHCGAGCPVTAQFKNPDGAPITLCATCLQNALNGIAYSLANPVSFDDPNYGKPAEPTP